MNDTITITGNVATDPEHKRTATGATVTTFRLASGQRRFDRASNSWVESATNFYSVSAWRGLADHAFQSLRRGERVILTGRLRVRDWDNGAKKGTDVEIEADAIGHDLRWGTTTFVKDAAPAAPGAEATWQAPLSHDVPPADEWAAAPDAVPDGAGESAGDELPSQELELAGVEPPF
ncbi:single-stranded DNA-binding protein [Microbacterium sp. HJ5]